MNLGIFVSGRGSNLQAIINAIKESVLPNTTISVVISNNAKAAALHKARSADIPRYHIDGHAADRQGVVLLKFYNVNLVVLAGYLKHIGPLVLTAYRGKIINIHPALLPRHGGKGMYGDKVHKAVLDAKEKITGVTIHQVEKEYDTGKIIKQVEVPVLANDTVKSLGDRISELEHRLIVEELIKILVKERILAC